MTMRDNNLPLELQPRTVPALNGALYGDLEQPEEAKLREYWMVLWKYRVLVGIITTTFVIGALLLAVTLTPKYTATSTIKISAYEPTLMSSRSDDMLLERSKDQTYFETQVQEVSSLSLADRVLEDQQVRNYMQEKRSGGVFSWLKGMVATPEIEPVDPVAGYQTPVKYLKAYLEKISVEPVRRTSLVIIKATAENAKIAALMANKHAESYVDWVRDSRIQQQSQGLKFLRAQADELREKVADLEREMADYAEANSIVAINKDENITAQKMSQLNKLLTDATAKKIEAENNYKGALEALQGSGTAFEDETSRALRSDLAKLEAEYRQLGEKFTAEYPRMQQLGAQIAALKGSMKTQRSQIVIGLKSKAEAAAQEEKNLKEELERQTSQAFDLSKRQVQYNILNRELTASRDLLQSILKQIKETGLSVESNSSNVSIVDMATVPTSPSFPRKNIFALLGLLLGGSLSLIVIFTLNYLDNSVRTPEDLNNALKLPCLGVVPSFELDSVSMSPMLEKKLLEAYAKGKEDEEDESVGISNLPVQTPKEPGITFLKDPKSLASESYRTIRTAVLLSQAGEPPRTLLVTSAQSAEGKTTSSVNLAASLASAGGKVCILDADLRRPSVGKYFSLEDNLPGLVEVITGQATIDEVSRDDVVQRITVIPSGKIPPNPAELLGSREMVQIIDELASKYDYVLIDSPPILPVTDSVILSRYVDGVIMVVKGSSTPRKVAKDAKERLLSVGARMLGVILNDVDVTSGDYYYYNRYYHKYHREEPTSQVSPGRRAASNDV